MSHDSVRKNAFRCSLSFARLVFGQGQIIDVAFDSGFGDVPHFDHRAFGAGFGVSPRVFGSAAGTICWNRRPLTLRLKTDDATGDYRLDSRL